MQVQEITAKSMLVASNLPDTDVVVNPYTGCEFACHYCYASFMGRFVNEPIENWGKYLYAKTNAVEVLKAELARLKPEHRRRTVFISSVTDPYQGAEAKYQLTRGILQAFAEAAYPGPIGILTKSGMVKRDVDILRQLPDVEVGLTITSTDDDVSRFMEVKAPAVSVRLKALEFLAAQGIRTYAFLGPLFPHFRYRGDDLEKLVAAVAATGVKEIYAEHINCKPYILQRLTPALNGQPEEVKALYHSAPSAEHREALSALVLALVKKHNLHLRLGKVIYHGR